MTDKPWADADAPPSAWGRHEDAEALRQWAFLRRSPTQRLAWLQSALELAYRSGALRPREPLTLDEWQRASTPRSSGPDQTS